ncbi:MAG TPA: 7,8-didemethyl-8-hydroxy-5-deazariboflavin synthase CofG [Candidatus Acidoferrales bacterium]|nr:7,8-didemethyl-8-hydroxy-5-deazariboflavin synthase CofG [Candidatus Acidoferrales bacterium]
MAVAARGNVTYMAPEARRDADRCATESASEGISREEALELWRYAPLEELTFAARARRAAFHGTCVSFSKKVFIPLTRLCRDYCGYCTFRRDPGEPDDGFLRPEEVLRIAEDGRRAGCKEALFSLGDQPEKVFPEARAVLLKLGFARTLDYLAAMCELVLKETGLLPHANPGVMAAADLERLKSSNGSMGLMLESVSSRLLHRGEAHFRAPDKIPAVRIQAMDDAGRLKIPFTTGILIGIGETLEERVDSLIAIRDSHRRYSHIQEVIVQNFRAKADTPMAGASEPAMEEMLRTLAIARLILDGEMNLQAPPNLSYENFPMLLDAGINDWGGISPVTRDWINPEAAWPQVNLLERETDSHGLELRERLAIYPEYVTRNEFVHPNLRPHLSRFAGPDGYARN